MTSHELARKLLTMPDVPVTVSGYEGGVDIVEHVREPRELHLNMNTASYYGKHEYEGEYSGGAWPGDAATEKTQGIHLT